MCALVELYKKNQSPGILHNDLVEKSVVVHEIQILSC